MNNQVKRWPEFRIGRFGVAWKLKWRGIRRWGWRNDYYGITLELPFLAILIAKLQEP